MPRLKLLNPPDPDPVQQVGEILSVSPFLLVGDHAGAAIPAALGDLGLAPAERTRHIALDIGVETLGRSLAERLGAPFRWQAYSRLVVDCNRAPGHPGSILGESDGIRVPGNRGLTAEQRGARLTEVFEPYHSAIGRALGRRADAGLTTVLVSLHSFTPVLNGERRPWEIGVLHAGHNDAFARRLLALLRTSPLTVGDNEPYAMDATDYTVPAHAYPRGLAYAEIEVRQDMLQSRGEVAADLLAGALIEACA
ncbi:MAG: N-formylglutamate amidohydrolase [Tsuneonella sp.]